MAENEEVLALKRRARRRLVGATAIVLLMLIIPPLLMDPEPKPASSNLSVDIPNPNQATTSKPVPPIDAKAGPNPGSNINEKPAARDEPKLAPPTVTAAPAVTDRAPERAPEKPAPKVEAPKMPPKPAPKTDVAEGYFVQIGVFSNLDRAESVREKINASGVRAYGERIKVENTDQIRLRAGPFASRDQADRARGQLEALGRDLGFKPGPVRVVEKRG